MGLDALLSFLAYMLDPALYPIPEVRCCQLKPNESCVESAWLQRLRPKHDQLHSNFGFSFNLRPYTAVERLMDSKENTDLLTPTDRPKDNAELFRGPSSKVSYEQTDRPSHEPRNLNLTGPGGARPAQRQGGQTMNERGRNIDLGEDMNSIRGWFNKGDWGQDGFLTAVVRLTYSLSEWQGLTLAHFSAQPQPFWLVSKCVSSL